MEGEVLWRGKKACWGEALLEIETLPSAKFFVECQKSGTRQRPSLPSAALGKDFFAKCRKLGKHGHSAKDFFAECQTLGKISALGIGYPRNGVRSRAFFAECLLLSTRQRFDFFKKKILCRVSQIWHSAKM